MPDLDAMRNRFREEGYAIAGRVLDDALLEEARAAYDRIFAATEKPSSYRNLGAKEGEEVSAGAVLQIIDMWRLDPVFERILHHDHVLRMASALMDSESVVLYHDQALFKPALHGDVVPWHQDNGYWRLDPPEAISLWIALDDVDQENGCMWVVPGSHRAGEVGHQRAGAYVAQLKADADEALAVPVPLPAGHGMFHHCRTLHMTRPNHSPRQRRAWVMHLMPPGTRQNGQELRDRLVLRGVYSGADTP